MPPGADLRAESTMPRAIRAARFFWKMPRYTTSQIRAAILSILRGAGLKSALRSGGPTKRYCAFPQGCQAPKIFRCSAFRQVPGFCGRGPQGPLHSIRGLGVPRATAGPQGFHDSTPGFGRAVLGQLELHPGALHRQMDGGELLEGRTVERIGRDDGPESALGLVARQEA